MTNMSHTLKSSRGWVLKKFFQVPDLIQQTSNLHDPSPKLGGSLDLPSPWLRLSLDLHLVHSWLRPSFALSASIFLFPCERRYGGRLLVATGVLCFFGFSVAWTAGDDWKPVTHSVQERNTNLQLYKIPPSLYLHHLMSILYNNTRMDGHQMINLQLFYSRGVEGVPEFGGVTVVPAQPLKTRCPFTQTMSPRKKKTNKPPNIYSLIPAMCSFPRRTWRNYDRSPNDLKELMVPGRLSAYVGFAATQNRRMPPAGTQSTGQSCQRMFLPGHIYLVQNNCDRLKH